MSPSAAPTAELSRLQNADGSATFSYCGFTVTAAVNGPVEAPRRDENSFEALVDIIVRPATGVGGTAERQLESVIQPALRQLIPIRNYPRAMIQVTLQITETPENPYTTTKVLQPQLKLSVIPALLHAAILGLLTANIPLKAVAAAVTLAITEEGSGELVVDPSEVEADSAKSLHVLGFTSNDGLLVAESEGSFSSQEWDNVLATAQRICRQPEEPGNDTAMGGSDLESPNVKGFIRSIMQTKVAQDLHWK